MITKERMHEQLLEKMFCGGDKKESPSQAAHRMKERAA